MTKAKLEEQNKKLKDRISVLEEFVKIHKENANRFTTVENYEYNRITQFEPMYSELLVKYEKANELNMKSMDAIIKLTEKL